MHFSRQHRSNHVQFAALAGVAQWAANELIRLRAVRGNATELEDLSMIEECRDAIFFADRLLTGGGQIGKA